MCVTLEIFGWLLRALNSFEGIFSLLFFFFFFFFHLISLAVPCCVPKWFTLVLKSEYILVCCGLCAAHTNTHTHIWWNVWIWWRNKWNNLHAGSHQFIIMIIVIIIIDEEEEEVEKQRHPQWRMMKSLKYKYKWKRIVVWIYSPLCLPPSTSFHGYYYIIFIKI